MQSPGANQTHPSEPCRKLQMRYTHAPSKSSLCYAHLIAAKALCFTRSSSRKHLESSCRCQLQKMGGILQVELFSDCLTASVIEHASRFRGYLSRMRPARSGVCSSPHWLRASCNKYGKGTHPLHCKHVQKMQQKPFLMQNQARTVGSAYSHCNRKLQKPMNQALVLALHQ